MPTTRARVRKTNQFTIKGGYGPLIGNAGEHLVIGELLRRGAVATLAPRNFAAFDVLVTVDRFTAHVRVKTKTAWADSWVWNVKKTGEIFDRLKRQGDFTILVDLPESPEPARFYVVPTPQLDQQLRDDFTWWVNQPPKNKQGRPHDPRNKMRRIGHKPEQWDWLKAFRDKWELITTAT
jgi:hypothetical protein